MSERNDKFRVDYDNFSIHYVNTFLIVYFSTFAIPFQTLKLDIIDINSRLSLCFFPNVKQLILLTFFSSKYKICEDAQLEKPYVS